MFNWFKKIDKEMEEIAEVRTPSLTALEAKKLSDVKYREKIQMFSERWAERAYTEIFQATQKGNYFVEVTCPIVNNLTIEELNLMQSVALALKEKLTELGYKVEFRSTLFTTAYISWEKGGKD